MLTRLRGRVCKVIFLLSRDRGVDTAEFTENVTIEPGHDFYGLQLGDASHTVLRWKRKSRHSVEQFFGVKLHDHTGQFCAWPLAPPALQGHKNGGAKEGRTPDLLNAIQALYQLSYSPTDVENALNLSYPNSPCQGRISGGARQHRCRWIRKVNASPQRQSRRS